MAEHFTRPNIEKVVGKLGTTPEQRGLSTQEFKDKFDEMPEAIQQYIKETLLAELDAFKQEFMTHQAESASDDVHGLLAQGKIIEDSGSWPTNGRYTKFADGVMIAFFDYTIPDRNSMPGVTLINAPPGFIRGQVSVGLRRATTINDLTDANSIKGYLWTNDQIRLGKISNYTMSGTGELELSISVIGVWKETEVD